MSYPAGINLSDLDIEDAVEEGVIVVASAGNASKEVVRLDDPRFNDTVVIKNKNTGSVAGSITNFKPSHPAGCDGVISSGALNVDRLTQPTYFTNFGGAVDVYTPGEEILCSSIDGYASAKPDEKYGGAAANEYFCF